nr:RICIN domain-containing protein [Oceanobacillus bengalensis]
MGVPLIGPIEVPSGEYRFEAEHGTMYNTKLNEVEDVSNKKTVSLNNKNGHLLIEDVNVPEAGTYTMTVKYSNDASADATNDVHVNGRPASILSYPNTGNRKFKEVTMKVDLNKGYNNTIKFMKKEHIVEIDYIEISGEVPFLIESGKDYKLINPNGGKALDIMDDGTNNVRTWESDDSSTSQIWKLVELGQGTYKIINPESGNVLSLGNDQTGQSVSVNIQKWKDSASQKWEIAHVGQGYFKLINLYNGEALDVSGASIDSGANVGTWENLPGGIAQMWLLYVLK